ncbi:MAG: hypothetical protein H0V76_03825 [Blastocatellia bacterium]|nr:hypothetical protein [Blastocatellia bacterium]
MFFRSIIYTLGILLFASGALGQDAQAEAKAADSKKNVRPGAIKTVDADGSSTMSRVAPGKPVQYLYRFEQPDFLVSRLTIMHDEKGRGTIEFDKRGYGGTVTDPIAIAPSVMEKITGLYRELNFLESSEVYQDSRDYSHLGNATLRVTSGEKTRTEKINWTQNKLAKEIVDQYRKIGTQHVWTFDIMLARENQPLETPKLMNNLKGLIGRNEIADPQGMLALLDGLANDERIPLMARNEATRVAAGIRKKKD